MDYNAKNTTPLTVAEIRDIIIKEFIDKPNKYKILEGLQISYLINKEDYKHVRDKLQTYPTIVLGTSRLKSRYRSTFRNISTFGVWLGIFTSLVFSNQIIVDLY